jgi:hypothetical protein
MDEEETLEEPKIIRVITKLPNEEPKIVDMSTEISGIQEFCQGLIDITGLPKDETVQVICNDNFLCNGMEPNIVVPEWEQVFCGPLIFTGFEPETGETVSLTDKQIEETLRYCKRNNLHHMSLEGAYRYSKVILPLQQSYDELGIDETQMEAY